MNENDDRLNLLRTNFKKLLQAFELLNDRKHSITAQQRS